MNRFRIAICMIVMVMLSGCSREPVKIGFTANLKGAGSDFSISAMYGAMLAVEEYNESDDSKRQIELLIQDDKKDPEWALRADRYFIENEVVGIIGHTLSSMGELSIDEINKENVVMISPTMSSSDFSGKNDFFYRMIGTSDNQGDAIVEALIDHKKQNVVVIYQEENKAFAPPLARHVKERFEEKVTEISLFSSYEASPSSYNQYGRDEGLIQKIVELNPDALVIIGSAFDVAKFAQEFNQSSFETDYYLPTWSMGPDLIEFAGPLAEGMYTVSEFDNGSQSPNYLTFKEAYSSKYGEEPVFASMYGYEAAYFLLKAIDTSSSLSGKDIKVALDNLGMIEGLQQNLEHDEFGDIQRSTFLFEIINGDFVKVD